MQIIQNGKNVTEKISIWQLHGENVNSLIKILVNFLFLQRKYIRLMQ